MLMQQAVSPRFCGGSRRRRTKSAQDPVLGHDPIFHHSTPLLISHPSRSVPNSSVTIPAILSAPDW